jgi:hypothetical protein
LCVSSITGAAPWDAAADAMIGSEANLARAGSEPDRQADASPRGSGSALEGTITGTPAVVWIFIVDTDEEAGINVLRSHPDLETARTRCAADRDDVSSSPANQPDSRRYVTWHEIYAVGGWRSTNAVENDRTGA